MSERPGGVNGIGLDCGPLRAGVCRAMRSLAAAVVAFASAASAEGLDRDTLLTAAPAVPAVGTVRLTGAGVATQNTANGATPIVVLNGVFGVETGGEQGKDVEAKAFAGWRLSEAIRAGIDGRLQAEIQDEARPATTATGRDYDLTAGPAVSWLVRRTFQLQALVGVAQPAKSDQTSPAGVLSARLPLQPDPNG